VTGYYAMPRQHAVIPVQRLDTDLYYNKNLFAPPASIRKSRRRPGPRSARARSGCVRPGRFAGFTTSWPSWDQRREFLAFHNLPISTRANGFDGLDAVLAFNNPVMVRHIAQLADGRPPGV